MVKKPRMMQMFWVLVVKLQSYETRILKRGEILGEILLPSNRRLSLLLIRVLGYGYETLKVH